MGRTASVSAIQSPGLAISSALWNAGPAASNTFLTTVPLCQVTQASIQPVSQATFTAITFDATALDTDGGHSNSSNNSRYVAQVAGWYLVIGAVGYAPNGTGARVAQISKNGVTQIQVQTTNASASNNCIVQASYLVQMAIGDYVETYAWQASGGTLNTLPSATAMQCIWLHI